MDSLLHVGDRISYSGNLGTVKYIGNVDNTTGLWLGVEWDNPERGKHDGLKDGRRYFSCRIPNSGSFIRPSSKVLRGVSFLNALTSKYIDSFHGSASQEKVTLGSSNGAIEVEAVNLDKIRGKFANLERLREVSLENELVASGDEPGAILKTCPNIRGLDLSTSLLSSWNTVSDIAIELPSLQRLALNRNRFSPSRDSSEKLTTAFLHLREIQLNDTLTSWKEMQEIAAFMPMLISVEMGYNRLARLSDGDAVNSVAHSVIQSINLDSNDCQDWFHICHSLKPYKHLERVIIPSNNIQCIPAPRSGAPILHGLKQLSLSSNQLCSWKDIDALSLWCPSLTSLTITGNPLVESGKDARYARSFITARMPSLSILDSTTITSKERTDCEIFYLSYVSRNLNLESRAASEHLHQEHPRWDDLCQKYGAPIPTTKLSNHPDKLSNRLREVHIQRVLEVTTLQLASEGPISLRVLPTMMLKNFRLKIRKLIKCNSKDTVISLWLKMNDGYWAKLEDERDSQDLDWLGLENGSLVAYFVH